MSFGNFLPVFITGFILAFASPGGASLTGDFDGDGAADAMFFDEPSGTMTVGYDITSTQPDWRQIDVRSHSYFNGRFLRAADLNSDQRMDLYVASREANRVFVFSGLADRSIGFAADAFVAGAGPAGAGEAPGLLAGGLPLAVPLSAENPLRLRVFQPAVPKGAGATLPLPASMAGEEWLDFRSGSGTGGGAGIPPLLMAALQRSAGESLASVFWKPAGGAISPPAARNFPAAFTRIEAPVFPAGMAATPWLVIWGEGHDELALTAVTPPPGAGSPSIDVETMKLKRMIDVRTFPAADRDLLGVVFEDGTAAVYQMTSGQLEEMDTLSLPGGQRISGLAALPGGRLMAHTAGPNGAAFIFEDTGAGFEITGQHAIPAAPHASGGRQVVLLSAPAFGTDPALELESFAAGHWSSKASLDAPDIEGLQEFFAGSSAGLISPTAFSFTATVSVIPGASPLGNQITADSSLFHDGPAGADGSAAVSVSPLPGPYAGTVSLTFSSGPGVTVRYRLDSQPWQTFTGPVFLTQSAALEFYGRTAGGELSAIRSGQYVITQDPQADANGDGVPDAIATRAGLDPLGPPDSDGDGFPDRDELLAGTNPLDAASHPADLLRPDTREVVVTCRVPDGAGGEADPAVGTELRMATLGGALIAVAPVESIDGQLRAVFRVQTATRFVVIETPEVFGLTGAAGGVTAGRRLSAVLHLPPLAPLKGPVDLTAPDPVEVWRSGVNETITAGGNHTEVTIDTRSTLTALVFEAWLGQAIGGAIGGWATDVGEGDQAPHIIGEPRAGARHLVSDADLSMLEAATAGDVEAFDVAAVFAALAQAVNVPAAEPAMLMAMEVFQVAAAAPADDMSLPQPAAMVRDILDGGEPVAGYAAAVSAMEATSARTAWAQILSVPSPREVLQVQGTLDLSGFACLMLRLGDGSLLELRDTDGSSWWRAANLPVVAGAGATLVGLAMSMPPECGDRAVQVLDLQVTSVPPPKLDDADGDGLDDSFEQIFFGGLDGGFWDDADGDGYANGEEQLGGTDPVSAAMFPAGPPATPAALASHLEGGSGHFTLEWDGNPDATYRVWISSNLSNWTESPVLPTQSPPGHFGWSDPASDPSIRFHRVMVTLPAGGE